ncbi:hypothetical protein AN0542.2 [Aspergillus nidulans FGSC A4]|uniref:LysM domain-containing protein n=1 Tax=Emericella nidulans (strain FGSC A4 / ATCC 38163 / CBS 112.46 / NRRL 194 / M139) TaxID=227321 RepID=Q5BFY8_EMENI|nr:hypothetical protein [Aspergillus nidulans FGSC A4]EAA66641.1 hypothetical protein AN0542.2 [Aspergillus nidulans FGSC A4]CBF89274.1 TPA: hypothetical protein ANIA_00542 [Aspergillus nidulans FGSC A4]|eukprot:XP_658146.1 hypothetical protein AN0542.2 [Aspergillus nidulans FGSC A4]
MVIHDEGFCKERLEDIAEDEQCSECYLKSVQLEINQPIGGSSVSPDEFDELKESCNIPTTSYPVDPTFPGTPSETAGDTINSIANALSVATDRLLMYNGLPLTWDEPFTAGEELCLDQVSQCLIHKVTSSDSCSSLLVLAGPSVTDLMLQSWNPTIGRSCANLETIIGKYICIGPPGQTSTFTPVIPSTTASPTITTPPDTYTWEPAPDSLTNTVNITTTWAFPTETVSIPVHTANSLPSKEDTQAMRDRTAHCPFKDEYNSTIWNAGLGDEEYHLHSWDLDPECTEEYWDPYCLPGPNDPILPSPTEIPSSCYPTITKIIPEGWVEPPGPTESGVPDQCNKWHLVTNGETCAGIAAKYDLSVDKLSELNPALNAQCSNLRGAFAICVRVWVDTVTATPTPTTTTTAGPPGPTGTGTSPTCTKWHLLEKGDTCDSIIAKYGLILSRFRQLNRSVDSECTTLVVGNAYCVGRDTEPALDRLNSSLFNPMMIKHITLQGHASLAIHVVPRSRRLELGLSSHLIKATTACKAPQILRTQNLTMREPESRLS